MRRRHFLAAATAALATPAILRAQELVPIHLATPTNDTSTPAVYAIRAGLFRRVGLDVDIEGMNSGAAASAAVAGGSAQFGLSSLVTIIAAHAKGIPFTLVAAGGVITSDVPYAEAIVRKDSPIRTGRDLNGKTFAVPALKDLNAIAAMAWIDQTGGDSKTVKFIELPSSSFVPALEDGRIDAGQLGTPQLTIALDSGKVRVLAQIFDAISRRFANVAWFTTQDYATKNADVVRRFASVMREASLYANAHHAQTLPLIASFTRVDDKVLNKMPRVQFGEYLDPAEIQPLVNAAAKYGVIDRPFDAAELISPLAPKPPAR